MCVVGGIYVRGRVTLNATVYIPIPFDNVTAIENFESWNYSKWINHSHFNQWYGSSISLIDEPFRMGRRNQCDIPSMFFVWDHKTGGYCKEWLRIMEEECDVPVLRMEFGHHPWPIGPEHKGDVNGTVVMRLQHSDPIEFRSDIEMFNEHRPSLDYVVIFMVRKPLNIVLSGYNYHAKGKETWWTDKSLNETHHRFKRPLIECFQNAWNPEEYVIDRGSTMFKEYRRGYANNYSDHEALQHGLYLEFTRFVNCEYPMMIAMYREIKNNDKYKWSLFLRFEWFHEYDYRESIAYLLEQIESLDSEHQVLLSKIRQKLNALDPSVISKTTGHMTRGKYNPKLQIDLLMKYDERTCGMLRNMTLAMDGKWVGTCRHQNE